MAWGYWTAYSTSYGNQNRRQRTLSPPNKRDRSLERERDRISLAATAATPDCVSRTSVTYVSGSGAGSGRDNDAGIMATAVRNHPGIGKQMPPHHLQENHVEPEKVAYERRLLLGEPDWANRTLADRNTLPRKKQPEYDKSSGSEALYSGGEGSSGQPPGRGEYIHDNSGHSPPTTPLDSGSHKSDEIFCPACAHQSSQAASSSRGDINSNRDSRVSFGSVASSSRGSRGSGSGRGGGNGIGVQHRGSQGFGGSGIMGRESIPISIPPPQHHPTSPSSNHHHLSLRARSRSQDDDDRCSSRGGLSSSLPTPPPPPTYSSHRDILSSSNNHGNADERIAPSLQSTGQGTASILMESINKKMSMFSKFKTPPQSQEQPYAASSRAPHLQNQYHHENRISSQKYHTMSTTGDGNNRESRNYYLHNPYAGATSTNFRQHYDENTQQPASILVQAATAAALNHYTTSTSSNRSIQKSSNTSSIEKAAGSSASRDQSSSSLHSLRGGGNESHEIHPIQSPTTMPFNMSSKPALPPKPSKPIQESNRQHSGDCDVHHFQQISRDGAIGHMERSKNQQQSYYPKEREDQGSSNSYHHQRSYSAGRRSNLVNSRSGSRTPRGSSSRTSRESLEHNKRSRESLSNTREKISHMQGHGEAKYSRTRGRRASNEQLEDADRDGDEESEGGNTNPRGIRNTNRNSEHRVRVTQHHHRDSSQHSGGRGSSTSQGRSSRESGSIIGIRNRKSSSVDEMTCGDATIHRGEYDDDVISTNSSSVKRRKSHIGVYTSNPSESKERVSNDADNENDLEDEEDEEDEDNRGTMRRRRIRTTSASDHSEVSGTRPPPFNTTDKNSTTRDRLSSGEIGDADVDEEEDSNQKEVSAKTKQVHSTPQDNSYNTNTRSLRSSQSQTPEDDGEICVGDKEMRKKIAKKVELCEKEKLEKLIDAPLDKSKLSIDNGENFSRSLSECDDYKKGYNAATLKRNVRKGSLSESKHDQTSSEKGSTFKTDQDHSGKRSDLKQVPFTASPPSFSISGTPDQSIFTFGRQSHSTTHQQCQEQTDPPISRSSMSNNSRGNVQYFKHYDHREQFQVQQSDGNSTDQHQLNFAHHARKQRPFNFKALTSTAPAIRKDLSDHPNRYSSERQLMADHRRKSASIGDRLSDADNFEDEYTSQRIIDRNNRHERENRNQNRLPFRDDDEGYRKSYTLDERHSRRGHGNNDYERGRTLPNQSQRQLSHNHHISSMGSFQNIAPPPSTIGSNYPTSSTGFTNNKKFHHHHQQHQPSANSSTKSEKSSSRSSHSPSIDGNKYVFPGTPAAPGMPCQGEDRSIYRRGARRWKKTYRVNGHIFVPKRFNRRAYCAYCHDRIWGLGRQGFRCNICKLLIHKKCHKLIRVSCDPNTPWPPRQPSGTGSGSGASMGDTAPLERTKGANGAMEQGAANDFANSNEEHDISPIEDAAARDKKPGKAISIDHFDLIRVIGRGSYAKVLMVELKETRRLYAMKVIKKELVTDDEDIDWVQTEKHVFETASNHPFLVGLHSCFQTPSRLFFVIEFVRGGDLMFHMQRQRRLPEEHARFYSAEISLALNFLHERGVIYRDLKLDNVLLDHEGHIKLTDYGMCKEGIRTGDTTSTFCGTPNYIAPEILRGEDYSFSVDWWALGVLLYEMLAGRSPFDMVGATDNPDQNTEDYLFQVILEKTIRIPRSLSVRAAGILKGFLNKVPTDRLGCHKESGFMEIMTHPFFKTIEWEALEQKQVPPPYRPRLESERDLANFPPEFTDEPVQLTPDDTSLIDKIDQSEFDGFEYINPLLMSAEDVV